MRSRITLLFLSVLLLGQAIAPRPGFDVASVKMNNGDEAGAHHDSSIHLHHSNLTLNNVTLRECIEYAYDLPGYAISGRQWLTPQRYDIIARAANADISGREVRQMLQTLLEQRFSLKAHRETRQLALYELVPAKTRVILHAVEHGSSDISTDPGKISARNTTMAEFADILTSALRRELGRPVVDKTGLPGEFTFTLAWVPSTPIGASQDREPGESPVTGQPAGPSIFTALKEQMGLMLQLDRNSPVEVLVIDHLDKTPGAN